MNLYQNNYPGQLPLLIHFAKPQVIAEFDEDFKIDYDNMTQLTYSLMPTVGTYSLKVSSTKKGGNTVTDRKNAIDDQKYKK